MARHRLRHAFPGTAVVLAVAVIVAGGTVWRSSYAAFTATTKNIGNSWTTGTVTITSDRTGSAVLTVPAARPDATLTTLAPPAGGPFVAGATSSGGSTCVKVTYTGSTTANIRMYAAAATFTNTGPDGGLGPSLLFDVDTGTNSGAGPDAACTGYTTSGTYLYGSSSNSTVRLGTNSGVAGNFPVPYAAGLAWNGATQNTSKWYRLSWLLPMNAATTAQGESVSVTFTWEAQNT
jgi:hypothetical protein